MPKWLTAIIVISAILASLFFSGFAYLVQAQWDVSAIDGEFFKNVFTEAIAGGLMSLALGVIIISNIMEDEKSEYSKLKERLFKLTSCIKASILDFVVRRNRRKKREAYVQSVYRKIQKLKASERDKQIFIDGVDKDATEEQKLLFAENEYCQRRLELEAQMKSEYIDKYLDALYVKYYPITESFLLNGHVTYNDSKPKKEHKSVFGNVVFKWVARTGFLFILSVSIYSMTIQPREVDKVYWFILGWKTLRLVMDAGLGVLLGLSAIKLMMENMENRYNILLYEYVPEEQSSKTLVERSGM